VQVRHTLAQPKVGLLVGVFFLATFCFTCYETTLGLLIMRNFGLNLEHDEHAKMTVGYLFAYMGFLSAVIQGGLIRRLTKRFSEKALALAGMSIYAVGSLSFILYDSSSSGGSLSLIPALTLIALGQGLINPTLSAIVSNLVSPKRQGEVLGSFRGIGSLGRVAGPLGGAYLYAHVAHWSPYLAGAVLVGGSFLFLMRKFEYYREGE
jgi:DHA1 family tetracycline resistance protein-like MFS transporter